MEPLNKILNNWMDIDVAEFELAKLIGLIDESKGSFQKGCKWLFCSNNKYGNTLYEMLMKMVEIGLLEFDEEELKIRFNQNFELIS